MRASFLSVVCCLILLSSCEEKAPVINLGQAVTTDTTFVVAAADLPPAQPHNVLVEEYTGVTCTNCPAAHEVLKELQKKYPGKINVIGLYITGPLQTRPTSHSKYDFRHEQATLISNAIYKGVSLLPLGGIDRVPINSDIRAERGVWASNIESRFLVQDSIYLKVESTYSDADSVASIRVTIVYTKPVSFPHNLSIFVVEDSIIDVQEYPSTDPVHPGSNDEYLFTNVFRGMVTAAPVGDPVLDSIKSKEVGRTLVRNYSYKITTAARKINTVLNPAHCRVVAFVNSTNGDNRVLQSVDAKMK